MSVRRALGGLVAAALVVTGVMLWQASADAQSASGVHQGKVETLGPAGYRKLRMGMTRAQVRHTHQASVGRFRGGCAPLRLKAHPPARHTVSGYVSARYGLVAVFATGPMHTPEGIRLGSTRRQVRAAYPHLVKAVDATLATVKGHRALAYEFLFQGRGKKAEVVGLALIRKRQDCFN